MKLLFVVSSLDLTQPFSATPAWWQLLKGLYEVGVEVIATPYQGPAIESLWWRAEPNPAKAQGDAFKALRDGVRRFSGDTSQPPSSDESASDVLVRRAAQTAIAPLWHRHLDRLLTEQPDIDAVIFLTVPLNHLVGVAGDLDFGDLRGVEGEGPLDAFVGDDAADDDRLVDGRALDGDDDAGEDLDTFLVAFDDADVDVDVVADGDVGKVGLHVPLFDLFDDRVSHGVVPCRLRAFGPRLVVLVACRRRLALASGVGAGRPDRAAVQSSSSLAGSSLSRSGRRSAVRWRACRALQRSISAWSPLMSTSGTSRPAHSLGRV